MVGVRMRRTALPGGRGTGQPDRRALVDEAAQQRGGVRIAVRRQREHRVPHGVLDDGPGDLLRGGEPRQREPPAGRGRVGPAGQQGRRRDQTHRTHAVLGVGVQDGGQLPGGRVGADDQGGAWSAAGGGAVRPVDRGPAAEGQQGVHRHRAPQQGRRQRLPGVRGGEHSGHRAPADRGPAQQHPQVVQRDGGGPGPVEPGPVVEQQQAQHHGGERRRRRTGAEGEQGGAHGGQGVGGHQRGDGPPTGTAAWPGRGQGLPPRPAGRMDRDGRRPGCRRRERDPGGMGRVRAVRRHRLIRSLLPGHATSSSSRYRPRTAAAVCRTSYAARMCSRDRWASFLRS